MMRWYVCAVLAILTLRTAVDGQETRTVIELRQPPERKAEPPPPMIGLEAFQQVLASGRYLVGPGDEFLIYMTGMEEPLEISVLAEGGLFIPLVGRVDVGGRRLKEAHRLMREAFREAVKVGNIDVELSKPRLIPIPILGMVDEPGISQGSGVERVSELIRKAGGLLGEGSERNIRLIRGASPEVLARIRTRSPAGDFDLALESAESRRVDLGLYRATGLSRYNPFVEDGDIIVVPARLGRIAALEGVQRPAFYEYVEGDRISDLLDLALGQTPAVDESNVQLLRYGADVSQMESISIDLAGVVRGDPEADLILHEGDWLVVKEIPGYHGESTVRFFGEVAYPGRCVVDKEGTPLTEVVRRAGGFTKDAALPEARIVRQRIEEREDPVKDPHFVRIGNIPVGDRTEDEDQYFIMKTNERRGQMVVDFVALFEQGDESQNIMLLPGDVIAVPRLQRTVLVSGRAAHPGAVIYDPDFTVWDYINRAGGLGWRASKDVRVIKARTGEMKRADDVEQIEPGDRIWIKEKPVHDYWRIFTQAMAVIGEVSTVVLIYVTVTK